VKIKNRNNLIRLIFVHLVLLAFPLVSKTFHVHHEEGMHHQLSTNIFFDLPEDPCPVCNFEFYNFVPDTSISIFVAQPHISVHNTPVRQVAYIPFIQFFSLRAPPVA
jgi:hypothetical protein